MDLIKLTLICILVFITSIPHALSAPDFPFQSSIDSLPQRAFSNQDLNVSFIINDIPIGYKKHSYENEWEKTDQQLQEAIAFARAKKDTDPSTLAEILEGAAALYYRNHDLFIAGDLIKEAIKIKKQFLGPYHKDIAVSYELLAQVARAGRDYENADKLYKDALEIKKTTFGENSIEVGSCYMNLACLYHDKGKNQQAEDYELKAKAIMDNLKEKVFISSNNTSNMPRPIPTSSYGARFNNWQEVVSLSNSIITQKRMEEERIAQQQQAEEARREAQEKEKERLAKLVEDRQEAEQQSCNSLEQLLEARSKAEQQARNKEEERLAKLGFSNKCLSNQAEQELQSSILRYSNSLQK